jgi:hypothetical protein
VGLRVKPKHAQLVREKCVQTHFGVSASTCGGGHEISGNLLARNLEAFTIGANESADEVNGFVHNSNE